MTDNSFQLPITNITSKEYKWKLVHIALEDLPADNFLLSDKPTRVLIEDICLRGQVTPIQVTKDDNGKYIVIDGRRRIKALRLLKETTKDPQWNTISAVLVDAPLDTRSVLGLSAIENNLRTENPLTDLQAIRYLMENNPQISEQEISRQTGIPISRIRKRLRLNKLLPEMMIAVIKGDISVRVAENIARLTPVKQSQVLNTFIEKGKVSQEDVLEAQRATVQENAALLPDFPEILLDTNDLGYVIISKDTRVYTEDEISGILESLDADSYVVKITKI